MDGRIELGKHGLAQGAQMPDYTSRIEKAYDFQKDQVQKELDTQTKRQEKAEGLLKDISKAKGFGRASRQLHEEAMGVRKRTAELMNNIRAGDISAMSELQDLVGSWKADAAQAEAVKNAYQQVRAQAVKNGAKTRQSTWDNLAKLEEASLDDLYNPELLNFGAETVPDLDADFKGYADIMDRHLQSSGSMELVDGQLVQTKHTKTDQEIMRDIEQAARDRWRSYESQNAIGDISRNYQIGSEQDYVDRALMQAKDILEYNTKQDPTTVAINKAKALKDLKGDKYKFNKAEWGDVAEGTTTHYGDFEEVDVTWEYNDLKESKKQYSNYGSTQPTEDIYYTINLDAPEVHLVANKSLMDEYENYADAEEKMAKWTKSGKIKPQLLSIEVGFYDSKTGMRLTDQEAEGNKNAKKGPLAYFGGIDRGVSYYTPMTHAMAQNFSGQDDYMENVYKGVYSKFKGGGSSDKELSTEFKEDVEVDNNDFDNMILQDTTYLVDGNQVSYEEAISELSGTKKEKERKLRSLLKRGIIKLNK